MSAVYHLLYGCFTAVCCSCKIFDRKKKTETPDFSDEMLLPQKPRSNSISEEEKKNNIEFSLVKNNELVQNGNTNDVIFNFDKIISYVSQYFSLNMGDVIYTGTPEGVGPVAIGDKLLAKIGEQELLHFEIK
jgi:2-keto-4-pentenoate hydratase/2-oxohepta-3-ene-1,7-dioic acid hydratase in catechol pathway